MNVTGGTARNRYLAAGISFLVCLAIAAGQLSFRRLDNNRFSSWDWVFMSVNQLHYFLVLVIILSCTALAFGAFRISLPSRTRTVFLFFTCYAAAAALWGAPEAYIDASRYFAQAKHLELYGVSFFLREWGHAISPWTDLPAVPFLYGLIFKLLGEDRTLIQAFNALLFAMTAVLASRIGKTLWDEETGFYAGMLLLASPYLLIQTPLMLVDVATMFFLALSVHLFLRALETGGMPRVAAASVAVFFTACSKYSAWPMLSVLPVAAAVLYFENGRALRRDVVRRSLAVFLLSGILAGAAIALKFDVVSGQLGLLMDYQRAGLERYQESCVSSFLFQVHPLIALAAAASLAAAVVKRDVKYLIAVWLPLLIVLFQIKRLRYTLPVFPFLTLMASYGLGLLQNREHRKVLAACAVAASLAAGIFAYLPMLNRWSAVNLKNAAEFSSTLDVDAVEVYPLPQREYPVNPQINVPLFDLFTHKKIIYHHVPGASSPHTDLNKSSNRFSFEYRNPDYYEPAAQNTGGKRAVALIFARPDEKVPAELADAVAGFAHSRSFFRTNPQFYYQTLVRIYW
jgi:hypothetical protein